MKKIILILGNVTFDNFTPKELKSFRKNTERKAIIHDVAGVIECESAEQAEQVGEDLVNTFNSYIIPQSFDGEILIEAKERAKWGGLIDKALK